MYNAKISLLASTGGIVSAGIFSLVIASFLVESAFLQAVLWIMCMVLFIVASSLYIQAYKLIGKQEEIEIERRKEEKLRYDVLKHSLEPLAIRSGGAIPSPEVSIGKDENESHADTNQD